MKREFTLHFLLGFVAIFLFVNAASGGGWSLVTVKEFGDVAVAGKPLNLTFTAWVPSLDPLPTLHPVVHATNEKARAVRVNAKAGRVQGEYTAVLTLPEPGDWVISVDTEYKNAAILPPVTVIAPGSAAPDPLSPATRGMRLFTAKGCNGCHLHPEVKGRLYGPDLTGKQFTVDYLERFLADPSTTQVPEEVCSKDRSYCGSPYAMPNLHLKATEIEALAVFISKK
jgi:hypothetical protein